MPTVERPVTCVVVPNGFSISPTSLTVPNSATDQNLLIWEVPPNNSATFEANGFEWKTGASEAPAVNFVNSKRLEAAVTYLNNTSARRVWSYRIKISGTWIDPEINNQPPGGGGGMGDPDPDPDPQTGGGETHHPEHNH
jgi:hypothetical protein